MKCCVIGGGGFIGSHVTRQLVESGREVILLDSRPDITPDPSGMVRLVAGDYSDATLLKEVLSGVDEVIHLAYSTVPQTSYDDPINDLLSNVPETVQLLQLATEAAVGKLLFVSSGGTVYGPTSSLPIAEDHPTNPISPYGITKLTLENYARMFWSVAGLPIVIVRPANAYGEEQRAGRGQGFIAAAIDSIVHGREFEVFGDHGTVRDYIHVSDVATGIVAALEHGKTGATYNVGSGEGRSNLEVLEQIRPLADRDEFPLRWRTLPARAFDVPANVLDSRRLSAVSGWRPMVDFKSGIERVWDAVRRSSRSEA